MAQKQESKALVQLEKASYKGNRQKTIYFNFVNQKFPNIFKSTSVNINLGVIPDRCYRLNLPLGRYLFILVRYILYTIYLIILFK